MELSQGNNSRGRTTGLDGPPSSHPLAGGPPAPAAEHTPGAQRLNPPWLSLPADLGERLAPAVDRVTAQIIEIVPDQIPAYAITRSERFNEVLHLGVRGAIEQLLSLPGTDAPALNEESRELVAALGAGEYRQGRSMDALLAAYRTGARITLRGLSEACAEQGMGLSVVVDLGESILAYIDELSAVSVQAYAFEQTLRAGALELRRSDLMAALLRGDAQPAELRRLAAAADWRLPERLAAAVLPVASAARVRTRLGGAGLVVERESEATAVVSADRGAGLRERLEAVFAGTGAVVGPAADLSALPHSHRVARLVASQHPSAAGPDGGGAPVFAVDHLGGVILGADPAVMAELASRRLAPLAELTDAKREVMETTLLSWLTHWGQRGPVAEELGVHPQTVGYRLNRLRELFGGELDDPTTRFELEMVLRARGA
ncbi:PucR family transcriptional regulator [Citricoccus sp. SGAir0253]|uniref:PucR family transcriptional regulator n=1 Tax=Citricoccus sp. SGAir0253 TaxID=2567881 RepID=UPI0010CD5A92|nr:PucR family transcriptional regulator [Citricoccus sp. SGAir0253]QCU77593.1 PucR family transcriptional regulator [Citricoccus sp. SGAir0253]